MEHQYLQPPLPARLQAQLHANRSWKYGVKLAILFFAVVFALMFLAVRFPAHAQQEFLRVVKLPCNSTKIIVEALADKFSEELIGSGLSIGKNQIRLFTTHSASKKQTWSILITYPDGTSCMLNAGNDWEVEPLIAKGDPP